jgi:hypothetical protein
VAKSLSYDSHIAVPIRLNLKCSSPNMQTHGANEERRCGFRWSWRKLTSKFIRARLRKRHGCNGQ